MNVLPAVESHKLGFNLEAFFLLWLGVSWLIKDFFFPVLTIKNVNSSEYL
jgi:hypothetical protein